MSLPRVMLVGPWKWTAGGVTTFMNNVECSSLRETYQFVRFNIARPAKRNVADNYGYAAVWRGGWGRVAVGLMVTLWHIATFPLALAIKRPAVAQIQSSDFQVFWEASLYVLMARLLRIPVLMRLGGAFDHFYGVSSPRARTMIRRVLLWPDRLIVQSQYWRQLVEQLGRTDGIVVLPNSVPDILVETSRPSERDPGVCFFAAGSEALRKGFAELLEAVRFLRTEGNRARLHVVAANDELRRQLADAGEGDLVLVDGVLTHAQILEAMKHAEIFLLPSRAEGFPNALVEAMALGLAPIATPVGAIPEIVEGTGAIIVPVNNPRALACAIAKLAADPALRAQIGEASREVVRSRYTHRSVMPILAEAWQSLAR